MNKLSNYIEAGYYLAICNNTNFDGHYARLFWFPGQEAYAEKVMLPHGCTLQDETFEGDSFLTAITKRLKESPDMYHAGHFFLNRADFTACLEHVIPVEMVFPHEMLGPFLKEMGAEETEGFVVSLNQSFFHEGGKARKRMVRV